MILKGNLLTINRHFEEKVVHAGCFLCNAAFYIYKKLINSKNCPLRNHDLHYVSRSLTELGLITPIRVVVKLQNIVATSSLGRTISLESLSTRLPQTIYEPDQFPGAIHYAKELEGASILIFANGKVVFAGLRRLDLLDKAKHVLMQLAEQIT